MELWIRSQDKKILVKCNDIVVNGSCIVGYFDKNTEYEDLGTYKSKERALEVLDEIQDKLNIRHDDGMGAEFVVISEIIPIIYEMPEE